MRGPGVLAACIGPAGVEAAQDLPIEVKTELRALSVLIGEAEAKCEVAGEVHRCRKSKLALVGFQVGVTASIKLNTENEVLWGDSNDAQQELEEIGDEFQLAVGPEDVQRTDLQPRNKGCALGGKSA